MHEADYEPNEWLFHQGDAANRLYYIVEGRLRLSRVDRDGINRYLGDLGPGESVGQTGLLVGDIHDASAQTLTPTKVLYFEHEEFRDLLREHPALRRGLDVEPRIARRLDVPDFPWIREDEMVIFAERRHWAYLVRRTAPVAILFLISLAIILFLITAGGPIGMASFLIIIPVAVIALYLLGRMVWEYINWRDDLFVLTTQRIIHLERVGPFESHFEEAPLDKIEDVYVDQPSFAANALNYGDVILYTAGEQVEIDLTGVAKPLQLRELVFRELERSRAREILERKGQIRERLEARLRSAEEEAPPLPKEVAPQPDETSSVRLALIWNSIKEYFFPSSWNVSEDGETIRWKRYWLPGFFHHFWYFFAFLTITLLGLLALVDVFGEVSIVVEGVQVAVGLWFLIEAVLFGILLWQMEDWHNDYFEITPTRVIVVYRKPLLLEETRRETRLDRIQNISFDIPNIIARSLKFGHVMIETAADSEGRFHLQWVRYPAKVQAEISRRQREFAEEQRKAEAQRRQEELLSWFDIYDNMRHSRRPMPMAGTDELLEEE
ncbi:MAG: cyclic nucleotide-binding domain-containing protein [Anaerolineales bacterium]